MVRQPVVDSEHRVPFIASVSDSCLQAFYLLMAVLQGQHVALYPSIVESSPLDHSSCPVAACGHTPVMDLSHQVSVVATGSWLSSGGFHLLLFVVHAGCRGIEALWLG